jgi:hypothetical protein
MALLVWRSDTEYPRKVRILTGDSPPANPLVARSVQI